MVRLTVTFVYTLLAAAGLVAGAGIPRDDPTLDPIPVGTPDGFYLGRIADDGSTIWESLGNDPATINPEGYVNSPPPEESVAAAPNASESSAALVKRDSISCGGYGIDADTVNIAQGQLADLCGTGYYFEARSIAIVYGGTVAYGCNYADWQTCHSDDLWSFYAQINSKCGFTHGSSAGAGWYTSTGWKAAYGRASQGTGFC